MVGDSLKALRSDYEAAPFPERKTTEAAAEMTPERAVDLRQLGALGAAEEQGSEAGIIAAAETFVVDPFLDEEKAEALRIAHEASCDIKALRDKSVGVLPEAEAKANKANYGLAA